ncbi:hypothetical protein [Pseudonocardia spinosispora]|uniref:hypothetical protein n=1 Tax=Pseudonocardia spinosispora TaxID=103441 RepID=UPI0012EB2BCD|nr:hypothetical protein [Pseudonocardia spinosispora]
MRPAGALDRNGLWLPGAAAAEPVPTPIDIAAAYQLGLKYQLRQLWIHPSLHEQLDIPAKRDLTLAPTDGLEHEFTASESMVCDPGGLAAWVNVKAITGADRRVAVVFPAYETRCDWRRARDGQSLLAAILMLGAELGENYYLSPNETGKALVRRTASSDPAVLGEADMPEPAGDLVHPHLWARHLLDEEDDDSAWVHRYDLNGAQPSVFGAIYVATAPYGHVPDATFEPKVHKNSAGYWLVNIPREGHGLDPRLPDLLKPLRQIDERGKSEGEPAWFCTDSVVLLAERGVPFTIHDAYIADSSVRILRKTNDHYRAARTALLAARDSDVPGGALAYGVLKSVFTSRIGDFAHEGAKIYRPDIRDAIIARAAANQYRRLRTIASGKDSDPNDRGTGRFPLAVYEDAVYYVSPDPDPVSAAPAGLPLGTELGQYSHEASLQLSVVREHTGTRNFHRSYTRALRGAMKGGR